mmetsp:Transcript_24703/g.48248  ORF Transcript_24703/g.48248 Transcript_24703/m.48248 type:complete len:327 (-) Transcript_24703:129-1109(-)
MMEPLRTPARRRRFTPAAAAVALAASAFVVYAGVSAQAWRSSETQLRSSLVRMPQPRVGVAGLTRRSAASLGRRVLPPCRATMPEALLFDCDGVLVDTEKDGHRVAFNRAFQEKGLGFQWEVDQYGKLLEVGGGKERMTAYFNEVGWPGDWPADDAGRQARVKELHLLKTDIFSKMVTTGELPLRPGVERLVTEALDRGVTVACCSTSNEKSVQAVVNLLPPEKAKEFTIFAGDVVPRKKPDPAVYLLASKELNIPPERCAVIEDSHIGKCAGKDAGMTVIVTKSGYTANEDFSGADAIVDELGDPGRIQVSMDTIAELMPSPLTS